MSKLSKYVARLDIDPSIIPSPNTIEGYTAEELLAIEVGMGIKISGQFREYMLLMGRKCKPLPFGDYIAAYTPSKTVEWNLFANLECEEGLQEEGHLTKHNLRYFSDGILYISSENECCNEYYLITKSNEPDAVWFFGDTPSISGEVFTKAGLDFETYLKRLIQRYYPELCTRYSPDLRMHRIGNL